MFQECVICKIIAPGYRNTVRLAACVVSGQYSAVFLIKKTTEGYKVKSRRTFCLFPVSRL